MNYDEIMKKCPRCEELPEDDKCGLPKSRRMRIGKDTGLKYQGLFKKEWLRKQMWEETPEAEKKAMMDRLKAYWFKSPR